MLVAEYTDLGRGTSPFFFGSQERDFLSSRLFYCCLKIDLYIFPPYAMNLRGILGGLFSYLISLCLSPFSKSYAHSALELRAGASNHATGEARLLRPHRATGGGSWGWGTVTRGR